MTPPSLPPVPFTTDDADRMADDWGFNCGPAALSVVTGQHPEQLRAHLVGFDRKRYMNSTMMWEALRGLGVRFRVTRPADGVLAFPSFGLARIQWGGKWCDPGVPIAARYRHTHWVAACVDLVWGVCVFDVNASATGGWLDLTTWRTGLVPALLAACEPRADGRVWSTHVVEVLA